MSLLQGVLYRLSLIVLTLGVMFFVFMFVECLIAVHQGRELRAHLVTMFGYEKVDLPRYAQLANPASSQTVQQSGVTLTYHYDQFARRRVPESLESERVKKYALFFGGSFTFGEGVSEVQNFPFYFQSQASGFRAYNYGMPGSGPHTLLHRFQFRPLSQEVKESEGIAIYSYISGHISRAVGDIFSMEYQPHGPMYELVNNQPKYIGSFLAARPFLTSFYKFIVNSRILNPWIPGYWYLMERDSDRELVCHIVVEIKKKTLQQLPKTRFVFSAYPGSDKDLIPCLERNQVEVFDFSHLSRPPITHPDGWHPSPDENKWYAELLAEKLFP